MKNMRKSTVMSMAGDTIGTLPPDTLFMQFVPIGSYDNYIAAHIALGRLEKDNISGWLKDENTVTIDPILSNAIGGIKLMVPDIQAERAVGILRKLENEHKALHPCPNCGSLNIELVSSPRKTSNWASVIIGLFITSYAMPVEKLMHCFDCGHEFEPDKPAPESRE